MPVQPTAPTVPATASDLAGFSGDAVGRYVLLREIGSGAMGRVFAGFDPDLRRTVAVKLVADNAEAYTPWLISEARALAALSHPNVVPVFDVGRDGDRVYIVMELVDGGSLADWLAQPRSKRDIVRTWIAAGRGLAAAHAAGIVHRDFKASNVLIAKTGEVRVADFGLARAPDGERDVTNPVEGTRGYLAPEVAARGVASEAADQYAFCTSLHHALTGRFPAGTIERSLPRRVRAVLARGLATDPDARWPSMTAAVDALERAMRIPRAVGGAAIVVVIGGLAAVWLATRPGPSCELGDDVIARELPHDTRDRLVATLRDSGVPHAGDFATRAGTLVDDGLAAWRDAYDRTCPRSRCLDEHLGDLATIVDDAIAEHGPGLVDVPIALSRWSDELASCASASPHGDQSRDYRHHMARALALFRQERTELAVAEADAAIASATEPAAAIRAKLRKIYVEDSAAHDPASYPAIADAARATGDPMLPAEAARVFAEACLSKHCTGDWIARLADAIATMPPAISGELRAHLAGLRGETAMRGGDPAVAVAMFEDEVRQMSAARGPESFELLPGLVSLAAALFDVKRFDEAIAASSHADAIAVHWLGPEHPYRAIALAELAVDKLRGGKIDDAIADLEHAVALRVAFEGTDSPHLASLYNNLAAAYQSRGQLALSLGLVDRALLLYANRPGVEVERHLNWLRNGATAANALGRTDAKDRIEAAFAFAKEHVAVDHAEWARLYQTRGLGRLRARELEGADADLRDAEARFGKLGDHARGERAMTGGYLALVEILRHRLADAHHAYDAAIALHAFPASDLRASYLDLVGAEVAIAGGDTAQARAALAGVEPALARAGTEPRLVAHYHLLVAQLDHDPKHRELAIETLRTAGLPEDAGDRDCAVCSQSNLQR